MHAVLGYWRSTRWWEAGEGIQGWLVAFMDAHQRDANALCVVAKSPQYYPILCNGCISNLWDSIPYHGIGNIVHGIDMGWDGIDMGLIWDWKNERLNFSCSRMIFIFPSYARGNPLHRVHQNTIWTLPPNESHVHPICLWDGYGMNVGLRRSTSVCLSVCVTAWP